MNGLVMDPVKSSRSFQRTKACSGADALLRRLRMRPMSKNSRAKTPTPVGNEIAGRLASMPVRSSSTPRTNCMSKSFIEWTGTEPKVFPSCSHGSRLNLTTSEVSDFLPVTSSQRTESCSTVGLCPNSINCPYTNHIPAPMTRSFMPYNSSCSLGTKVPDMSLNNSHLLSAACQMCACTAGCCQHVRPTNDMRLTAPNELYRPLSQPTCYFLRHGSPSVPDLEDSGARRMMTHFSTLPWPATSTNELDTYTRPELPLNNASSALDPNHTPNYCPGISSQPTGINSTCIPASMLASYPSVPRHGQFAFPSSRTTEALFVNCGDSKPDQPQKTTVPGHVASSGNIWHPGLPLGQGVYDAPGTIYSPRAHSTEQPRDSSLYWSSVPPLESVSTATQTQGTDQNQPHHYHPHPHKQHQQHHHQTVTSETTVQSNQTRPDSLLSTSSLTTADSSQTDSLPNSSSSRDSALGGNLQQTDLKGMNRNKVTGLNASQIS
ncbi:hypothetical protein FGIG_07963 [Fasciola gigantica]|uniref:Uncharacterized protein n=1 Tax=Fasciola gigantica TaxID=46835 RepID=A0A504Z4Z4_FASGI|nr:hypothetical protein FGIG_07963 [Fasciola gigantica]